MRRAEDDTQIPGQTTGTLAQHCPGAGLTCEALAQRFLKPCIRIRDGMCCRDSDKLLELATLYVPKDVSGNPHLRGVISNC